MAGLSKPKMYDIAAVRAAEAEKRGGDSINFAIGGEEFSIPAPGFMPDEIKALADDDGKFVPALLGDNYEKFRELGGRGDDIALLFQAYARGQGASLGE